MAFFFPLKNIAEITRRKSPNNIHNSHNILTVRLTSKKYIANTKKSLVNLLLLI